MGSDRKHRPQASLTFCQKDSAAMALLKVTGMGRSPRWNLQKGTLLAWAEAGVGWGRRRPRGPVPSPPPSQAHLLEGLAELAAGRHAQLLRDVGRHLQQQHLHQPGHDPVLQRGRQPEPDPRGPRPGHVDPPRVAGWTVCWPLPWTLLPSSPAQDSTAHGWCSGRGLGAGRWRDGTETPSPTRTRTCSESPTPPPSSDTREGEGEGPRQADRVGCSLC